MSTSVEQLLEYALLNNAGVSTLLGNRIYLCQLPQGVVFPCAVYQRIATVPLATLNQPGNFQSVGWCRFQITVWSRGATSGAANDTIARAIRAAMLGFSAYALPASPPTAVAAPNILLNQRMLVEPQTNPPLFKVEQDWRIWYQDQ